MHMEMTPRLLNTEEEHLKHVVLVLDNYIVEGEYQHSGWTTIPILVSKYQHSGRIIIPTSSIQSKNHTQNRTEVHLKDSTGLLVGRGVVESQVQTGDDVARLILLPHQIAV